MKARRVPDQHGARRRRRPGGADIEALDSRAIAGRGLDVFADEPFVPERLRRLENVVLLPHLGSATEETRVAMGMKAVENLTAFFEGRPPPDRVA